ncbi:MAG TPA: 4-hydroxy-tetrahydrodipicolinate synthase [Thermoplasmata archaeon]|nr:4-hydroxy-tetrahydrodipicolinate synthase [Thermoplasmata archaeon]
MYEGCYTAVVTPFSDDGTVDYEMLHRLVEFQVEQGASGVVAVGTTGESPTLTWDEHLKVIARTLDSTADRFQVIAGTGSNSTSEAIDGTRHAWDLGARNALLVDPYYNGPSSLEIRKEYYEPLAIEFPEMQLIPYIIPGRTGTQLSAMDLGELARKFSNIRSVKDAVGNFDWTREVRKECGPVFDILSGDDDKTFDLMLDAKIQAAGTISVVSNLVPGALTELTYAIIKGRVDRATQLRDALAPLFGIVTVSVEHSGPRGPQKLKFRNPLAVKTALRLLGVPVGQCRKPLGRMTKEGVQVVLNALRKVHEKDPAILEPLGDHFDVDVPRRLEDERSLEGLHY